MAKDDTPKPLPDTWRRAKTPFLVAINKLYSIIEPKGVSLNQAVQRRESDVSDALSGISRSYSLEVLVDPIGVEVKYVRMPAESRTADDGATFTRIDEKLTVRHGTDVAELKGAFIISHDDGGLVLNSEDPLFKGAAQMSPGDIFPKLIRTYADAVLSQASAAMVVDSLRLLKLPVEIIPGVKGLRRKINLAHVERFDDVSGRRYSQKSFEEMVIPALVECYPKICLVEYDHLYIMTDSLVVDCKGRQLLEAIVRNGDAKMRESVDACLVSYLNNRGKLDVYEHDGDSVRLVEHVFSGSGEVPVYVYATEQGRGLVDRILSHYIVNHRGESDASIEGGRLVLCGRDLTIGFLGRVALSEFERHEKDYEPNREKRETASSVKSALDEF